MRNAFNHCSYEANLTAFRPNPESQYINQRHSQNKGLKERYFSACVKCGPQMHGLPWEPKGDFRESVRAVHPGFQSRGQGIRPAHTQHACSPVEPFTSPRIKTSLMLLFLPTTQLQFLKCHILSSYQTQAMACPTSGLLSFALQLEQDQT